MLNNTTVFSSRQKAASIPESEAVFFHLMSRTQRIAHSSSFERPVPWDGDAHGVGISLCYPIHPPPPHLAELSLGPATVKQGAAGQA